MFLAKETTHAIKWKHASALPLQGIIQEGRGQSIWRPGGVLGDKAGQGVWRQTAQQIRDAVLRNSLLRTQGIPLHSEAERMPNTKVMYFSTLLPQEHNRIIKR